MYPITFVCCFLAASVAHGAEPAEPLLRDLPPGLVVKSSVSLTAEQTKAIAARLGGKIERLTNSVLQVHGRLI